MFNGAKPQFGATGSTGFGYNNATATSPFGAQTAFGKPPTAGFGQTPAFGQTTSLFGSTQPTNTLFGASAPTPAFGAPATTQSGFGGTLGGFGQPQQQQQQAPLFGATAQPNQNTSLFGQPSTSGFGVNKPGGFGYSPAQPATSLFGQASTSTTAGTGFGGFGATTTSTGTGLFGTTGAPAFGQAQQGASGSAIVKYQPLLGTDTLMKSGQSTNVNTKQHCITAMKEYENKCLEEIRIEDYMANRKGPQAGSSQGAGGMFGTTAPSTTGLFGAQVSQPSTGLFGQQTQPATNTLGGFGAPTNTLGGFGQQNTAFGQQTTQQANAGLFGKTFPQPATSTAPFSGFAANTPNTSLFGAKPFGQQTTTGLFGQPATAPAPGFGQPQTGFGTFGQTSVNQPTALFGGSTTTNAGGFGIASSAQNNTFGFSNPSTNTMGGGLFGQKPATGFGGATAFGAQTSTAPAFGTFGQPNQSGSLFNNAFNKPAAPTFGGFGAQATAPTLGGGLGMGTGTTSLFGNNNNKPGGLFGNTTTPAPGGLFGPSFGATNTLGGLAQNTMGMNQGIGMQQPAGVPIHQQILSLATSPYGDNPIFKDLKQTGGLSEDALKPTNPAAQKAMLESTSNQFKISPKVSGGLKVKALGSAFNQRSLFGGLEEFDSTVEGSFSLKPNAKRLIIKSEFSQASSPATQSPATPKFTSASLSDTTSKTLNVSTTRHLTPTPRPPLHSQQPPEEVETFRNQIPTTAPPVRSEDENSRRVSWLHSNALEKVTKQNRISDFGLDNTINELVTSKENVATKETTTALQSDDNNDRQIPSKSVHINAHTSSDSLSMSRSFLDETSADLSLINTELHPAGVVLQRSGYYTIPPLDKLVDYIGDDGTCKVPNFTIGRRGYGNVYYDMEIDVSGLNLDELVHFRHKEVIIYPDDDNKPTIGKDLNRKAQITLDQVWPHDKTLREPIKDKDRLEAMDYEGKLRRVCDKHDMRFIDYRPETGSWVFRVDHFSKYGLSDSDEDELLPGGGDPKKAKLNEAQLKAVAMPDVVDTGGEKGTGAIPKQAPPKPIDVDVLYTPQSQGLGGFDARYEPNADNEFPMDFTAGSHGQHGFTALSPSAAIAIDMGTDAHKLQLMKASFFIDDEFDGKSVISEQLEGRDSPDQIVPNRPYFKHRLQAFSLSTAPSQSKGAPSTTSSSKLETPIESPGLLYRDIDHRSDEPSKLVKPVGPKSLPLIVKPKVAVVKFPKTVIPLHISVFVHIDGRCIADMAIMHGRKFKVGWAAQNSLMMLSTLENCQSLQQKEYNMDSIATVFKGRTPNDYTRSVMLNIKLTSTKPIQSFHESIENHLQTQLKCSKIEAARQSDCPHIQSGGGTNILVDHLDVARHNAKLGDTEAYAVTVWSLCNALWGDQEELDGHDVSSHLTVVRRRELISDWLESVVTEKNPLKRTEITKSGYLEYLLSLIMCHKVVEACELAFNNDDINLACLLAQLSGGPTVRQLMQHQLSAWQDVEADNFIAIERLKAVMLVAGVPLMSSSHGVINIFEDLDWLKSFAVHIWYLSAATASITDSLLAYERFFQSDEFHAVPPTPPYAASYHAHRTAAAPIEDLRYHLLKLYSKRSHPMECLLNPATHTPDPMDFRLSWLLLQVLETIGYHHCSELSKSQLHISFASQLENNGLWHWAIFVLLHIENQARRELCVQNVLYKYILLSGDDSDDDEYSDKEAFVVNELQVPKKWIYWAKAVRAGAQNKYHAQADYLLRARQWAMAHDVIMMHIAPDAVINDNISYVKTLLNRFDDPRQIPNWSNQGSILLDYIELSEKFETLKTINERDIEHSWEQLKPQLSELCSRINLFPCPTAKHRLCQSEIAQRLANLVSGVRIMCSELNSCVLLKVILEKLPLPQEYAKQKFRTILEDSRLIDELLQGSN